MRRFLRSSPLTGFVIAISALGFAQERGDEAGLGFTDDFESQGPASLVHAAIAHDDGSGMKVWFGGDFDIVEGYPYFPDPRFVVAWDGAQWYKPGPGFIFSGEPGIEPGIRDFAVFDDGTGPKLFAVGGFQAYWNGSAWVGGIGLARWEWPAWTVIPGGYLYSLAVYDDGSGPSLYAGAYKGFIANDARGTPLRGIGRWDGQAWHSVGPLNALSTGTVHSPVVLEMCVHDDGSGPVLFVGGAFVTADGQPADGLAIWDGQQWTGLQVPFPGQILAMASYDDGSGPAVYVGSFSGLWRLRGGEWSEFYADPGGSPWISGLHVFDDGNGPALFVSGLDLSFPDLPPGQDARLLRWDGVSWQRLGGGVDKMSDLPRALTDCDLGDGPDLYVGGPFGQSGGQSTKRVARYRAAHGDVDAVCGGDGSLLACPCDRKGDEGFGCPNSVKATGAKLEWTGSPADDSLVLEATSLPPSTLCILMQGDEYDYAGAVSGNGVRCVVGETRRLFIRNAVDGAIAFPGPGDASLTQQSRALGVAIDPGDVRTYQVWYRDPDPSFCAEGGAFNATNGVRVAW